ncbi:MAG: chromophore lyase CpcT/CpeT [Blastocatellia bacterium]
MPVRPVPYFRRTCLVALFLSTFVVAANAQSKNSALDADLKQMMSLFEGEFDNFAQVWEEKEQKAQYPHEHIHSIFHRVKLPAIGENVFYVKQYTDGDPAKVYRQRLYKFTPNEKEKAIELDIYQFPDEKAVTDAHLDQSKLAGLTADKLRATPGCEVFWKREGEDFMGYMKPGACRVKSQRSGKTIVITDDLKLNRNEIWIRDQAKDEEGNYVFGHKGNVHHKLKRAHYFDGWFALRKDGSHSTEEAKPEDFISTRGLRIHNQGGLAGVDGGGTDGVSNAGAS